MALADAVKTVLPAAKVTYAADWSEYFGFQPPTAPATCSSTSIRSGRIRRSIWSGSTLHAAVGLARGGCRGKRTRRGGVALRRRHAPAGRRTRRTCRWFYASQADRQARLRTPITDGSAGKPGSSGRRPRQLVEPAACGAARRPRAERDDRWGAEIEADLVHRAGCPAIDKGATSQRLPSIQNPRKAPRRISPPARTTISCSGGRSKRSFRIGTRLSGFVETATRFRPSMAAEW